MALNRLREIQYADVVENPGAFGAPTFEEFSRNPSKYLPRDDEALASMSGGPTNQVLRRAIDKVEYEFNGYRCRTLEEVERIATDHGVPINRLDYRVQIIPETSHRGKFVCKVATKEEFERRRRWR